MVTLLTEEKRRLLKANGTVTSSDFRAAWDTCWEIMVLERAWAHQTSARRSSRGAMLSTRSEYRAAFLDEPTSFSFAVGRLSEAAAGMCLHLEPEQIPRALLAAIAYAETPESRLTAA